MEGDRHVRVEASSPPVHWVSCAIFVAALTLFLALTAWFVWRMAVLQPYSDMFDWLGRYFRFTADGDLPAYLLEPHNFHRPLLMFGALALDVRLFGGESWFLVGFGGLCLAGAAALMAGLAASAAQILRWAAGGLGAMATLMAGNLLDASIPINTPYVHTLAFAVLAIALAEPRGPGERPGPRLAAALASFVAATLGTASGLALWPVMLFAGWRSRAQAAWLLTVLVVGGAYVALYAIGNPVGADAAGWDVDKLGRAGLFLLSYLGLPWTRAVPGLGWLFGLAMLAAATVALVSRGGAEASRPERVATRLILYALGVAMMIALARTDQGAPADVPLRYAAFLAPLHVGLLMLAWPYVERMRERRPTPVDAAVAAVALLLLAQQMVMGVAAVRTTDVNRQLIADFRDGRRTPAMTPTVHGDLAHAAAVRADLDRAGLYQGELHLRGTP